MLFTQRTNPYFAARNIDTRFGCRKHKHRYIHMNVNMADPDDFSRGIPRTRIPTNFIDDLDKWAELFPHSTWARYLDETSRRDPKCIPRPSAFSFYRDLARSCSFRIDQSPAYRATWIQPWVELRIANSHACKLQLCARPGDITSS